MAKASREWLTNVLHDRVGEVEEREFHCGRGDADASLEDVNDGVDIVVVLTGNVC